MCEFIKTIGNEKGYVAQCIHCETLEIVFGNSIIHLAQQQWRSFLRYILHVQETHHVKNPLQKTIMLDIAGTEFFQMYLTGLELEALYELLEKADDEMKVQKLIQSFND